jgi:hypothetical protein
LFGSFNFFETQVRNVIWIFAGTHWAISGFRRVLLDQQRPRIVEGIGVTDESLEITV